MLTKEELKCMEMRTKFYDERAEVLDLRAQIERLQTELARYKQRWEEGVEVELSRQYDGSLSVDNFGLLDEYLFPDIRAGKTEKFKIVRFDDGS